MRFRGDGRAAGRATHNQGQEQNKDADKFINQLPILRIAAVVRIGLIESRLPTEPLIRTELISRKIYSSADRALADLYASISGHSLDVPRSLDAVALIEIE